MTDELEKLILEVPRFNPLGHARPDGELARTSDLDAAIRVIRKLREQRLQLVVAYKPLSAVQYWTEDLDSELVEAWKGEEL